MKGIFNSSSTQRAPYKYCDATRTSIISQNSVYLLLLHSNTYYKVKKIVRNYLSKIDSNKHFSNKECNAILWGSSVKYYPIPHKWQCAQWCLISHCEVLLHSSTQKVMATVWRVSYCLAGFCFFITVQSFWQSLSGKAIFKEGAVLRNTECSTSLSKVPVESGCNVCAYVILKTLARLWQKSESNTL